MGCGNITTSENESVQKSNPINDIDNNKTIPQDIKRQKSKEKIINPLYFFHLSNPHPFHSTPLPFHLFPHFLYFQYNKK